jgi:UDP-N-acetylglucosamine 4-epimerase
MNFEINNSYFLSNCRFLITGGAGFIGSNLAKYLISHGAGLVRILDNLSNGDIENLAEIKYHPNFEFILGDICDLKVCLEATEDIHYILHHAALGSIQRSLEFPIQTNEVNVVGFINILESARKSKLFKRLIYASSSSVYGDSIILPKKESINGVNLISNYAVSKFTNELYASSYSRNYGIDIVGFRYFNVFGPNQKVNSQYGAVIPLFMQSALVQKSPIIYGDGFNTRDFTYVDNVVSANILAITNKNLLGHNLFNIATGNQKSLNELWNLIKELFNIDIDPIYQNGRLGDIKHSYADISKAKENLGYYPSISFVEGLKLLHKSIMAVE